MAEAVHWQYGGRERIEHTERLSGKQAGYMSLKQEQSSILWMIYDSTQYVMYGVIAKLAHPCNISCEVQQSSIYWYHVMVMSVYDSVNPVIFGSMQKAWLSIEKFPNVCQGHPSNFKVTQNNKMLILVWIECNSSLNSPMDLKWCTKLKVV